MPFATSSDGARIYYRLEGDDSYPLLLMVHSLGADHSMWDAQAPALLSRFQILRVDLRGHGASDAPGGDYTMAQLAGDVLRVIDTVGRAEVFYCGLSIGGMIGQWIAANAAGRITRLVIANSSSRFGDGSLFEARRRMALEQGMPAIAEVVIPRFFTARTIGRRLPRVASIRNNLLVMNAVGYAGCCAALRDADTSDMLSKIHVPTLVIVGDHDVSTPWEGHGELLAAGIAGAQAVRWPTAHLSNIEMPSTFTAELFRFLLPPDSRDLFDAGLERRREVLGDAHVDRVFANATAFTREFQEMITRYAWGEIWTRPQFDARTRRMLALTTLVALGRWEEFRQHVRTALANELEAADLKEMLMQSAIYAGVPAANTGFAIANEEIEKLAT